MEKENFLKLIKSKSNQKLHPKVAFESVFELLYEYLKDTFKRKEDEVAIFILDKRNILNFLYPAYLGKVGVIPKDYKKSFVWRLIEEKRGIIDNNFETAIHLHFFESAKDKKKDLPHDPIQKIMGIPLVKDDLIFGAIEISKKGKNLNSAGEDFSKKDLNKLKEIVNDTIDTLFAVYDKFISKKL